MIVIKIELWPGGNGYLAREIGRAFIVKRPGSTEERGDYDVAINRRGEQRMPSPWSKGREPTRRGEVLDYPRRAYSVWRLLMRALRSAFPEER